MKLLLIENERSIRRALCLSLQRDSHEVFSTESLTEGYYLNETQDMDLVIIDADLMARNHLDAGVFRNKPLLVLFDQGHGYIKSLMNNGVRTLEKPFSLSLFKNVINNLASKHVCELSA
jgi:DNA-binding response OmpR family regulator